MQIQINGITPTEKYVGLGILIGLFILEQRGDPCVQAGEEARLRHLH